jgi:TonB family protein
MRTIHIISIFSILFFACKQNGDQAIDTFSIAEEAASFPENLASCETYADFVGGQFALNEFLKNNITYPESAINVGVEGVVFVRFVVEKDGSITNVSIIRGLQSDIDKECVKAIEKMPRWTPGKQSNIPVRMQYSLPIRFSLSTDSIPKGFAIRPKSKQTNILGVKLFPNPVTSLLNIELIGATENVSFQIIDSQGKLIKTGRLNNYLETINVSNFTNGFYIIKLTGEDQKTTITEKFIKK